MTNSTNKKSHYVIRLINNDTTAGTYRVSEEIFLDIQKQIKPYRSTRYEPKKIRCIETGEVFEKAKDANEMLIKKGLSQSYAAYSAIKDVCNKKRETAYGYHWEFVDK